MSEETQAQREARLQREAFIQGVDWQRSQQDLLADQQRRSARAVHTDRTTEALHRYPDPPVLTERREKFYWIPPHYSLYRWNQAERRIEREYCPGRWSASSTDNTDTWLDFANDLRAWPLVDQRGTPCRREPDGTVTYKPEAA